jgi:hypothetical protein
VDVVLMTDPYAADADPYAQPAGDAYAQPEGEAYAQPEGEAYAQPYVEPAAADEHVTDPAQWARWQVGAGTVVYHVTTVAHAMNIARGGVQQVANAFGGGRLGAGFYTHTNADSAALYTNTPEVTLEFHLDQVLQGAIAPQNVYVSELVGADYVTGNDFITAEEDTEELKFHSGNGLVLVNVIQGGQSFPVETWLGFLGDDEEDEGGELEGQDNVDQPVV